MQTKFPVGTKVFTYDGDDLKRHWVVGSVPDRYRESRWAYADDIVWFDTGCWYYIYGVYLDTPTPTRKGILEEVQDTLKERGTQNGYDADKERSAAKIAKVFNSLTGRDLTEQEAWTFMICLKLVRNQNKPRRDNIVDLIGYAALLGESQGEAI